MKELIQQLKSLIKSCFISFRAIASYLVPKKKGVFAFYPILYKREFAGNIKALMLYVLIHHKEINPILLSLDKDVVIDAKRHRLKTKNSVLGIVWTVLRAEHIVVDASTTGNFTKGKFSLIQLWHGSGFKEVGIRNKNITKKQRKNLERINKKYNLIISTSESEAKKQRLSFKSNHVVITGYPRNDVFFNDQRYFDGIKSKYKLQKYSKIIAYIPTFRDTQPIPPFSDQFYENLQQFLEEINAIFIVKKHPADKFLEIPGNFSNIKDLSYSFSDVQELLLITDVLISDYSSVVTDFALTQKPILIYPYDLEQYKKTCRSLYYNLEEILPQPFIQSENDLLNKLKDKSWRKTPEAINSYTNFVNTFHKYANGNSSKRVMKAIQNLTKKP